MNFFKKLFGGSKKPEKVKVFINETLAPGRSKYCNVNKILVRIHIQSHTISKADSHVSVKRIEPDVFNMRQGSKMDLWICEHTINPEPNKFKCSKKCVYSLGVQMAAKSDFEIAGDKLNNDGTVPLEFLRRAGGINFTSDPKVTDK